MAKSNFNTPVGGGNPFSGLFNALYNSRASEEAILNNYFRSVGKTPLTGDDLTQFVNSNPKIMKGLENAQSAFQANPLKTKVVMPDGSTGNALKNTMGLLGANVKAHPLMSAGLGALGVSNIAGLTDDDKLAGQLLGSGAGFLASNLVAHPAAKAAIMMGGGTLGSLFDKLRAKKEAEQQMYQQMYQQE
jgi:hypothetical protein